MAQLLKGRFRPDVDPRELALYVPADAAYYLDIHPKTLGTWINGRTYTTIGGDKFFEPVIEIADRENGLLSFFNLAELHVLAATRYQHKVGFPAVRAAMDMIRQKYPLQNVVADEHDLIKMIYPLIPGQPDDKVISITYGISSSQPVIDRYGVPVWLIHDRYKAGETIDDLADDFAIPPQSIRRAIDYSERRAA